MTGSNLVKFGPSLISDDNATRYAGPTSGFVRMDCDYCPTITSVLGLAIDKAGRDIPNQISLLRHCVIENDYHIR